MTSHQSKGIQRMAIVHMAPNGRESKPTKSNRASKLEVSSSDKIDQRIPASMEAQAIQNGQTPSVASGWSEGAVLNADNTGKPGKNGSVAAEKIAGRRRKRVSNKNRQKGEVNAEEKPPESESPDAGVSPDTGKLFENRREAVEDDCVSAFKSTKPSQQRRPQEGQMCAESSTAELGTASSNASTTGNRNSNEREITAEGKDSSTDDPMSLNRLSGNNKSRQKKNQKSSSNASYAYNDAPTVVSEGRGVNHSSTKATAIDEPTILDGPGAGPRGCNDKKKKQSGDSSIVQNEAVTVSSEDGDVLRQGRDSHSTNRKKLNKKKSSSGSSIDGTSAHVREKGVGDSSKASATSNGAVKGILPSGQKNGKKNLSRSGSSMENSATSWNDSSTLVKQYGKRNTAKVSARNATILSTDEHADVPVTDDTPINLDSKSANQKKRRNKKKKGGKSSEPGNSNAMDTPNEAGAAIPSSSDAGIPKEASNEEPRSTESRNKKRKNRRKLLQAVFTERQAAKNGEGSCGSNGSTPAVTNHTAKPKRQSSASQATTLEDTDPLIAGRHGSNPGVVRGENSCGREDHRSRRDTITDQVACDKAPRERREDHRLYIHALKGLTRPSPIGHYLLPWPVSPVAECCVKPAPHKSKAF